jgi:hypothetical protein
MAEFKPQAPETYQNESSERENPDSSEVQSNEGEPNLAPEQPRVDTSKIKEEVLGHIQSYYPEPSIEPVGVDVTEVPKKDDQFASWLHDIPKAQRVKVSENLIKTKGKKLMDVIHAFVSLEDYQGLDDLAEALSESYDELVTLGVLPDLRRK